MSIRAGTQAEPRCFTPDSFPVVRRRLNVRLCAFYRAAAKGSTVIPPRRTSLPQRPSWTLSLKSDDSAAIAMPFRPPKAFRETTGLKKSTKDSVSFTTPRGRTGMSLLYRPRSTIFRHEHRRGYLFPLLRTSLPRATGRNLSGWICCRRKHI